MARITVQDCIKVFPNRFELVIAAAQRARDLSSGAGKTIDANDKKATVISLREIAAQTVPGLELLDKAVRTALRITGSETEETDDIVDVHSMKTIGMDDPQFKTISERQIEDDLSIHDEDESDDLDDEE